jgi:hypothetical protein
VQCVNVHRLDSMPSLKVSAFTSKMLFLEVIVRNGERPSQNVLSRWYTIRFYFHLCTLSRYCQRSVHSFQQRCLAFGYCQQSAPGIQHVFIFTGYACCISTRSVLCSSWINIGSESPLSSATGTPAYKGHTPYHSYRY